METKYFIVTNKQKKADQEQAGALLYELNAGGMIISAVPAADSVHYIIGSMQIGQAMSQEDINIIRDNLDVEERLRAPDSTGGD